MRMIDGKGREDGFRRNEAMNSVDLESPHMIDKTPPFLGCQIETGSDMHRSSPGRVSLSLVHRGLKVGSSVYK